MKYNTTALASLACDVQNKQITMMTMDMTEVIEEEKWMGDRRKPILRRKTPFYLGTLYESRGIIQLRWLKKRKW